MVELKNKNIGIYPIEQLVLTKEKNVVSIDNLKDLVNYLNI
ncbi:MAG: hypothetical protein PUA90_04990 [bacterium]|nr:hypothetical protein [bacterium]